MPNIRIRFSLRVTIKKPLERLRLAARREKFRKLHDISSYTVVAALPCVMLFGFSLYMSWDIRLGVGATEKEFIKIS